MSADTSKATAELGVVLGGAELDGWQQLLAHLVAFRGRLGAAQLALVWSVREE